MSGAIGPIDFLLLEFPGDADTKACADALMDLVERDTVHLFDLLVIRKAMDGSYSGIDLRDMTSTGIGGFHMFAGSRSGLVGDDDIAGAAAAMEAGTTAALLLYENTWAAPFVGAVLEAGGGVIASQRVPATDVIAALDRLDAEQPA